MGIYVWETGILAENDGIAAAKDCCCDDVGCKVCDSGTTPTTMIVTFHAGALQGLGFDTCISCSDWEARWELPKLTLAEINEILAIPNQIAIALDVAGGEEPKDVLGCIYGTQVGLPCSAEWMVYQVNLSGSTGFAGGAIALQWPGPAGEATNVDYSIAIAPATGDCKTNLKTNGNGLQNVGQSTSANSPCDLVWLIIDATLCDVDTE